MDRKWERERLLRGRQTKRAPTTRQEKIEFFLARCYWQRHVCSRSVGNLKLVDRPGLAPWLPFYEIVIFVIDMAHWDAAKERRIESTWPPFSIGTKWSSRNRNLLKLYFIPSIHRSSSIQCTATSQGYIWCAWVRARIFRTHRRNYRTLTTRPTCSLRRSLRQLRRTRTSSSPS